jgi:hyperosmotically inducible protein
MNTPRTIPFLTLSMLICFGAPLLADEPSAPAPEVKPPPKIHAPKEVPKETPKEAPKASDTKPQAQPPKAPKAEAPAAPEGQTGEPANGKVVLSLNLAVKLALMADPRMFQWPIEVEANGTQVVLSGKVPGETESAAAGAVALGVPGVTAVLNKLELAKDLKQTIARKQDEVITAYVKKRFDESTTLKTAGFAIKTEDGTVVLSGKTRFQVIVLEAAEAARQVPGVRAVRSDAVRIEGGE